jgi:hypothetical protein
MATSNGFYVAIFEKLMMGKIKILEIKPLVSVEQRIKELSGGDNKKIKHFGYVLLSKPVDEYRQYVGQTLANINKIL